MSKVVIQNRYNSKSTYRWVRTDEFYIRSLVSGRFYRSKSQKDVADKIFIDYNYLGKRTNGVTANPMIGAENIKKVDKHDHSLRRKNTVKEYPISRKILQTKIMQKVWENPNMLSIAESRKEGTADVGTKRNGVQVLKKRFCRRVPIGQEHLLSEKSGVQVENPVNFT